LLRVVLRPACCQTEGRSVLFLQSHDVMSNPFDVVPVALEEAAHAQAVEVERHREHAVADVADLGFHSVRHVQRHQLVEEGQICPFNLDTVIIY
jgi:hypothetical protein